jgi:hypothetical protein
MLRKQMFSLVVLAAAGLSGVRALASAVATGRVIELGADAPREDDQADTPISISSSF